MHICSECKDMLAGETDELSGYPILTVIGGIVGLAASAATGTLVAIPAAAIVGAIGDIRSCDNCGKELSEEDPGYQVCERTADDFGNPSYRPAGTTPNRPTGGQSPKRP